MKNYFCGECGHLETADSEKTNNGLCVKCNADNWIELEDFNNPEHLTSIAQISVKTGVPIDIIRKKLTRNDKQRRRREIFDIEDILEGIMHPVFHDAEIDPDVIWKLTCGNCHTEHKFSTDTKELDPCCDDPILGEINK